MDSGLTLFLEERIIARGDREAVTRLIEERYGGTDQAAIRAFDDSTGKAVDLDYWDAGRVGDAPARARGRPKLGVTAREVTLLPRHWDWLATQKGGASAAIRRLIDEARARGRDPAQARDAAYRFMTEMGGDRPGYEEALRALYRDETKRFRALIAEWPEDIRTYIDALLES